MRKRYIYALLFTIPGFFLSLMLSFAISGAVAGFLWLYVFGDDPWPASTEVLLPVLSILSFLVLWIATMVTGYATGKKLEQDPALNIKHILASSGVTAALVLLIVLHQYSVGNTGQPSDGARCSGFCNQQGYSGSGMPPRDSGERTCSCYDHSGKEVVKVPLDGIAPAK